jgi:prepilin-type N-terminal cleavage/methylation domain-containing protein
MNRKLNTGFSLVELSVVLVIIGLIIASIAGGSHLLYTAKLNNVISEMKEYESAVDNFRNMYKNWPGDMPTAEDYWGTYHATNNPQGVKNGDGDESIDTASERFQAWSHMSKAGLITGEYDGTGSLNGDGVGGVNIPKSSGIDDLTYFINVSPAYGTEGIHLSAKEGGGFSGILKPDAAYYIEKKMDDGEKGKSSASTGDLFSIKGDSSVGNAGECVDQERGHVPPPDVNYELTDPEPNCRILYWLEKH